MKFFKNRLVHRLTPPLSVLLVVVLLSLALPNRAAAQIPLVDPNAVRAAVRQMGMDTLSTVIVNDPPGLSTFERLTPPPLGGDNTTNPIIPAVPASLQAYAAANNITIQRAALRILGKALFWDQQTGSDGQACASCHFIAGSDNRTKNTLNPGSRNTNPADAIVWNQTHSGQAGGPNYELSAADFPFHVVGDPFQTNYMNRDEQFDTDDIVGSIGTFHANFAGSPAPNYSLPFARGVYDSKTDKPADIFNVGGVRTRSNGPRQSAPTINAMFNFNNFWDGRADNSFNGLNMHGIKDLNSFIYFNSGNTLIRDLVAGIGDGALASQSTAPPDSQFSDEMAFSGRTMQDLGRKIFRITGPGKGATATATIDTNNVSATFGQILTVAVTNPGSGYIPTPAPGSPLGGGANVTFIGGGGAGAIATATVGAGGTVTGIVVTNPGAGFVTAPTVVITSTGLGYNNIIPLGAQNVDQTDSVLGPFKNAPGTNGGRGINLKYVNLVQWAFVPTFWDATGQPDVNGVPATLTTPGGFHLMEQNLPMFWGISIQMYEMLLRADQSPYDRFMAGDNSAFGAPTSQQAQDIMRGLLTYIHTENTFQQVNPVFNNINFGACQLCHSGPELTEVSKTNVPAKFFVTTDMTVKMDHNRELAIVAPSANFDVGFTNVGSRPLHNDLGLGGDAPALPGTPLSITRQGQKGFVWALLMLPPFPAEPNPMRGTNVDGAFKIPHLRNVEMNGPYFHNGGMLTLKQVVEFYARHGDFADLNEPNIDVGLAMVQNIGDPDADLLVKFLLSLTDQRVRMEQGPFDHPELIVPIGNNTTATHTVLGAGYAQDNYMTIPAVGTAGRAAIGLGPLPNFMGISSVPVAGPNNDHFDP